MSTEIKGAPWLFKGVKDVSGCRTAADVMSAAKLDWTVEKCALYAEMPYNERANLDSFNVNGKNYNEVPNAYGIFRTDYNIPLGTVKSRYTPVQNIEAFNFFDGAIGKNKAIWQTAGCFDEGRRIFVSAKLPKNIFVNGDPVENYLVFTNNHDGNGGIKILFTPIRIICQNSLNAAIRGADNYVSIRHTTNVHSKLDIAAEILGISEQKIEYCQEQFKTMERIPIKDIIAMEIMGKTVLTTDEINNINDTAHNIRQIIFRNNIAIGDAKISMRKVNILSDMWDYYFNGPGQREYVGSGWGVYNAISGYYSNRDSAERYKRMDSLLYGDKATKIKNAGNLILEMV